MRGAWTLMLVLTVACAEPVPVHFGPRPSPVVVFSNPSLEDGDPVAGRQAFIDAMCVDCHRVEGDPDLPRGPRAAAGRVLRDQHRVSGTQLANRIMGRETGIHEELFDKTMKDYAQPLPPQQLVDVVAYLRNVGKGK
jgi:mono/diheme cytochrome c family protein